MVGRVTDIEGVPGNPNIVYVGSASGGVWKTEDGGITWQPIFDDQPIASIGDIALEPGNPDVIYVGTGESNTRNSVSFGNGVYKSTDGGRTWKHCGLADTERISRIVINPRRPEMVYVGALGHAFGPNKERGVFMSTDGGETWKKVLYLDDRHGVADMDIDVENPHILYAALWHFERKPWTFRSGSEEGGIWRSVDGGRSWTKLTRGLPKLIGRISVKVAPSNPKVVYAMTESKEGTLFRSDDRGENFRLVSRDVEIISRGFYYTDMRSTQRMRTASMPSPLGFLCPSMGGRLSSRFPAPPTSIIMPSGLTPSTRAGYGRVRMEGSLFPTIGGRAGNTSTTSASLSFIKCMRITDCLSIMSAAVSKIMAHGMLPVEAARRSASSTMIGG